MLQRAFPLQLIDQSSLFWSFFMRWTLGLLLLIAGSVTISAVHRELFKFNQSHKVGHSATALVTTGPFAVSRHPTYASAVFLFVPGVALLWNNAWAFLTQPLAMLAFYYVLIRPEEAYLLARFPEEYKRYRQQTRRWI
jgi:protein-S-isoprenylcysteine O-methyltransferase Ste14